MCSYQLTKEYLCNHLLSILWRAEMSRFDPDKLHTVFLVGTEIDRLIPPRRYTMTHSDRTGDVFLSIGKDYNHKQLSGFLAHFMRDEVLAEWMGDYGQPSLHVYVHVSGGLAFGPAGWREKLIRNEMSFALKALRHGDRTLYEANPYLDRAPINVHFEKSRARDNIENWGVLGDYKI
jgi:hypothetical protein